MRDQLPSVGNETISLAEVQKLRALMQQMQVMEQQDVFDEDEGIDLRYYWLVVTQYKWKIIALASIVTLLVSLYVYSMTPIYSSSAALLIENKQNKVLAIEDVYAMDTSRSEYLQTQFEILKSPDLARRVIKKLKLGEYPEFAQQPADASAKKSSFWDEWFGETFVDTPQLSKEEADRLKQADEDRLVGLFLARLNIKPRPKTQLVDISFEAADPKLARVVVSQLGNEFIDSGMEAHMESTRKAVDWLSSRLQSLKDKLTTAEINLQQFLSREHLVDLEGVLTLVGKEIDQNSERLTEARQARLEAESIYNKIRQGAGIELIPEAAQNQNIQYLKQKKADITSKVSELAQHYGKGHPMMLAAQSELKEIENQFNKEIKVVAHAIKNRYEIAKTNEDAIAASIDSNKQQVLDIGRKQTQYLELQREVESSRNLYQTFVNRFKEASEVVEIDAGNVRFINQASNPSAPIKPRKSLIIASTFVVMLMFGIGLVLLLDFLDSTLKEPDDVEKKLARPFLGVVPLVLDLEVEKVSRLVVDQPRGSFAEAIRTIRTGLVLSALDSPKHVWMITSSFQGEGKSTLAMNMALAIAQLEGQGRVLLIDADLRRPVLHKRFNLPTHSKGMSHVLAMNAEIDECLYPITGLHLDVLPAGITPPNPLELLSSRAFSLLLETLGQRYSVIIIDAPPVHAVSDAQWLAQHARSVIYVAKAETTSVQAIKKGIKSLEASGTPLAGVVLTQLDVDKSVRYGKGDYSGYYYYQSAYNDD